MRDSILGHTLTPTQVANLTSADLASEARAKEIEAAKQAVLEQTVKSKEDGPAAIRLGRDGLERAEDFREKEMKAIQAAEIAARDSQWRDSTVYENAEEEVDQAKVAQGSPSAPKEESEMLQKGRSESADIVRRQSSSTPVIQRTSISLPKTESPVPAPVRQFSLSSAWGPKADEEGVKVDIEESDFGVDQNQVDLSDIVPEQVEEEIDFGLRDEVELSAEKRFEQRSVVWKGGVSLPLLKQGVIPDPDGSLSIPLIVCRVPPK